MGFKKTIKIGLLGEIRAGKDTVAKLISQELKEVGNKKPTRYFAFSTGIHDVIRLAMPYAYDKGKPRKELQHIGQSLRELHPDVWIDYLFNLMEFKGAEYYGHNIMITDVRQPNEVKRLQEKGYIIIKVTASKEVRMQRAIANRDNFNPESFEHETEHVIHQCSYDYLIDNSYSVGVLEDAVRSILKEVAN